MKRLTIVLFILIPLFGMSQNPIDAYGVTTNQQKYGSTYPSPPYNGEYQVFLDKFFWSNSNFEQIVKSLKIEVVSIPFIPIGLEPGDINSNLCGGGTDRQFDCELMQVPITNIVYGKYRGTGWNWGNWKIFKVLYVDFKYPMYGRLDADLSLISGGFVQAMPSITDEQAYLPHSILKHTLYFHCVEPNGDLIIDSVSWLYDNTRGRMKFYPFRSSNTCIGAQPEFYDVLFRPELIVCDTHSYNQTSNEECYESGCETNTGSVDFFPPEEIVTPECSVNFYPPIPMDYSFDTWYVHPPRYSLIDAPLLNNTGQYWAGFNYNNTLETGCEHEYYVFESIQFEDINETERIIYNPSLVTIYDDIVFPCLYKFLTVHGKYPDKSGYEYWAEYWQTTSLNSHSLHQIPVSTSYCDVNAHPVSIYKLRGGITVTIEPEVALMDLEFRGTSSTNKAKIIYDPDLTYGNWTYDPNTVTLLETNYEWRCDLGSNLRGSNGSEVVSDPNDMEIGIFKIYPNPAEDVLFIEMEEVNPVDITIYDALGKTIKVIKMDSYSKYQIDISDLNKGIYFMNMSTNNDHQKIKFLKR